MCERSILRLRTVPHSQAGRPRDETIVEVVRDGEVVATIYGSREGVHIVSTRFGPEQPPPLYLSKEQHPLMLLPGWIVPVLGPGEPCPWCDGLGFMAELAGQPVACILCRREVPR